MISDYLLLLLSLFTLSLAIYFTGLLFQKIELLKLAAISVSIFFTGYILSSSFYFWADRFQFTKVLLTECICFVIGIIVLIVRNRNYLFVIEKKRRSICVYVLVLCGILISFTKFSFFGMGQDEGVYQTKAIALAYGYSQQQFDFEEYQLLETENQRATYDAAVKSLIGLDRYDAHKPTLSDDGRMSPVSGIFHGIPTFPAVLGLMVKIFDVSAMQHVQSIFFVCALLFILFTVENMGLKKSSQILSLSIAAFSPIVQWVVKSALTEGFLILIFAWFIYHITDKEHNISRFLSVLPVCTFSFWHVSAFTIMPLFICLYIISYEETKSKTYIYAGIAALVSFFVGIAMMMCVSPIYTCNNVRGGLSFLEEPKIIPVFFLACIVIILFLILIDKIRFDMVYKWMMRKQIFPWLLRGIMLISFVAICWFAIGICTGTHTSFSSRYASGSALIPHLSILVFAFGTGIVSLPMCIYFVLRSPAKILQNKNKLLITVMFVYCVILMSAFLRKDIPYSYYYARYLSPFIVVCSVTVGIILDGLSTKAISVIVIATIAFLIPYDCVLLSQKDDSRMEWSVLSEIANNITEDSAVVFDPSASIKNSTVYRMLLLPIKTMTGADVYPTFENRSEQINFLLSHYKNIFIVTSDLTKDGLFNHSRERYVYINGYTASEDMGDKRCPISQFPLDFTEHAVRVGVLKYRMDELEYDLYADDTICSGFDVIEKNYFRWSLGDSTLSTFLSKKDYLMKIIPGTEIPFGQLGRDHVEINVAVNGNFLQSFRVTPENMNQDFYIVIPEKYLEDGENSITFYGDTWSPSDYGSSDTRKLLISISKVLFIEYDASIYDFGEQEYFPFSGFSNNEGSFRWTNESPAEIRTIAIDNDYDYQCSIELGAEVPFENLGLEKFDIKIVINGNENEVVDLTLESNQKELTFEVNKELLNDETNTIQIYTPLWSPSDYGSSDTRTLGISIDKIIFTPKDKNP